MNTLEAIAARHCYRGLYEQAPVPREDLTTIMQAGLDAPTGCNRQTVSLIAVDDPAVLARLRTVLKAPVGKTAPAMVCVLSRHPLPEQDQTFCLQDYAAAIENMMLAITELGYHSCWVEGDLFEQDMLGRRMADILGVPADYDLVCFLPVGRAVEPLRSPRKRPFEERAWFNSFGGKV